MPHYIALDVSQKTTAICIVDEQGRRVWRGACITDPEAISARIFRHAGVGDVKVGVETGSITPWLVHGLRSAGLDVECLERPRRSKGEYCAALGGFDGRNVVFEHDMMHRLLKPEPCQPAPMQLGPRLPVVMAALAQQKPRELMARAAQGSHRVEAGPHQVARRLVSAIGNPHCRQLAEPGAASPDWRRRADQSSPGRRRVLGSGIDLSKLMARTRSGTLTFSEDVRELSFRAGRALLVNDQTLPSYFLQNTPL